MNINQENQKKEVNANYQFFKENQDKIQKDFSDKKFILMNNKNIMGGFNNWEDAKEAAKIIFKSNENYSIQEIHSQPVHLGYQSYALL